MSEEQHADDKTRVEVFLDGADEPIVAFRPPVNFELDTTRLEDGPHLLRVEAYDSGGMKGVREIPFTVRNGPGIAVHGITPGDVVDGKLPVLVNAYGGANEQFWEPSRVETPAPIPTWTWVLVIFIVAFGVYYAVRHWAPSTEFATTPTFGAHAEQVSTASAAPSASPAATSSPEVPSSEATTAQAASSGAPAAADPPPVATAAVSAVSTDEGAAVYGNYCSACHQANGQGLPGVFPPLAGDPLVLDPDPTEHVRAVLHGRQGSTIGGITYSSPMPAFAAQLSDEQIAAVVNHERASWGNSAPGVSAADVGALR